MTCALFPRACNPHPTTGCRRDTLRRSATVCNWTFVLYGCAETPPRPAPPRRIASRRKQRRRLGLGRAHEFDLPTHFILGIRQDQPRIELLEIPIAQLAGSGD